jgi:hypothetical protein
VYDDSSALGVWGFARGWTTRPKLAEAIEARVAEPESQRSQPVAVGTGDNGFLCVAHSYGAVK